MLLGPVFHIELTTTSRRSRYFVMRTIYGLILLSLVGWTYSQVVEFWRSSLHTASGIRFFAELATAIFTTFVTTQVAAVLCITPALVAGTIADERQRKTLHYLLASELSSWEIICGKLVARMLQLVILVAVGLPIMSILSLFGGLDPELILVAFAGTLTTAFCLASLSILVSTVSRSAREACVTVYILEALWLSGPTIIVALLGPTSADVWKWLETLVHKLDPFQLTHLINPEPDLAVQLIGMASFQVGFGLLFIALAVWRLRPTYANSNQSLARSMTWQSLLPRLFRRPEIGNDPMLWKEMYVTRLGPVLRFFGFLASVFTVVFLGDALLDHGRACFAELAKYGYGDDGYVDHRARDLLQEFISVTAAGAYLIWMLGVSVSVAAGFSSEQEDDTWLSLLGTTLSGGEILRAKVLGAMWRWRLMGLLVLVLWMVGLVSGAIHPIAYVLALAAFVAFTAFAAALGSFVSLRATSTTRAMVATVFVLFVLNGGYLMCLLPMSHHVETLWMAPCTPYIISIAPARYSWVQYLFGTYPLNQQIKLDLVASHAVTCLMSIIVYSAAAIVLGVMALNRFDKLADRPKRLSEFQESPSLRLEAQASVVETN